MEELQRVVSEMANSGGIRENAVPVRARASAERTIILRREDSCAELDGSIIRFTEREFRLLELLGERAGSVVSRESILSEAWDSAESASNAVDVYIGYLRRKLEPILGKGVIVAVRGAGYQFTPGERKLLIR
jgi:DNA-binding response OmpR family regulator